MVNKFTEYGTEMKVLLNLGDFSFTWMCYTENGTFLNIFNLLKNALYISETKPSTSFLLIFSNFLTTKQTPIQQPTKNATALRAQYRITLISNPLRDHGALGPSSRGNIAASVREVWGDHRQVSNFEVK